MIRGQLWAYFPVFSPSRECGGAVVVDDLHRPVYARYAICYPAVTEIFSSKT